MRTKVRIFFVSLLLGVLSFISISKNRATVKELSLLNIEALADYSQHIACSGSGSVDCRGYQVEVKVTFR